MNPTEAGHQWTMKGLIEQLNRTNQSLLEQKELKVPFQVNNIIPDPTNMRESKK